MMVLIQRSLIAVSAIVFSVLLIACGGASNTPRDAANLSGATMPDKNYPYKFVNTKTEPTGHNNVMDLFAFSGELKEDELSEFCKYQKSRSSATAFYFVVIFDDATNAKFPSSPFTAKFGLDDDTKRHIRALYVCNRQNGFSELSYHEKNIYEFVPTRTQP